MMYMGILKVPNSISGL